MKQYTHWGFRWGPMTVQRVAKFPRPLGRWSWAIEVKTAYASVDIYVSHAGRSIRVFKDGNELK